MKRYNFWGIMSFPNETCFKTDVDEYKDFIWIVCGSSLIMCQKEDGKVFLDCIINSRDIKSDRLHSIMEDTQFFIESDEHVNFTLSYTESISNIGCND